MADGPTSTPSVSPSPSPSPVASASASPSTSPSPSPADATAGATAAPAASGSPSPTPDPEVARAEAEAARARDAALLANARSLAQVIEAQARVAQDELAGLDPQIAQVAKDLDAVKSDARRTLHDRLEREAFRLAALPTDKVPTDLSAAQREALDDLLSLQSGLLAAQTKLTERADLLATLKGSVGAKQAQLARLRDRARSLAAAAAAGGSEARAAQVAVLTALAQDATNAQTALAQLVASAMVRDGESGAWSLPVRGIVTQPFGPTSLELEPPATYGAVAYAHFHAAIDLAASLGSPVTAASDGMVAFVGHARASRRLRVRVRAPR